MSSADRQGGEAAEALPAIGPWRHLSEMERSTPFRRQEWGEVAGSHLFRLEVDLEGDVDGAAGLVVLVIQIWQGAGVATIPAKRRGAERFQGFQCDDEG